MQKLYRNIDKRTQHIYTIYKGTRALGSNEILVTVPNSLKVLYRQFWIFTERSPGTTDHPFVHNAPLEMKQSFIVYVQLAITPGASGIKEAKNALKKTQAVQRIGGRTVDTGRAITGGAWTTGSSSVSPSSISAGGTTYKSTGDKRGSEKHWVRLRTGNKSCNKYILAGFIKINLSF